MSNKLYEFTAYNTESLLGWGDEDEAAAYCAYLNRKREINVFAFEEVTDAEEVDLHDKHQSGVNLADALHYIADADSE